MYEDKNELLRNLEFGNVDYTIERKAVSALVRRKPKNEN